MRRTCGIVIICLALLLSGCDTRGSTVEGAKEQIEITVSQAKEAAGERAREAGEGIGHALSDLANQIRMLFGGAGGE